MRRIEKTVFISYRRINFPWALAIYQELTKDGFDVFFDFTGIASGDFESVILENVKARAHFVVLLTPFALDRCNEPGDWLRREIETALKYKRNIVPLMLDNFDFGAPGVSAHLTGGIENLKNYNALRIYPDYFAEAMGRLRDKYLNVQLSAVPHPVSRTAKKAAEEQQAAAASAHAVKEKDLTAAEWFERAFKSTGIRDQIRCYSEAIRLKPNYVDALINRGILRGKLNDSEGELADYGEAIHLKPRDAVPLINRGAAYIEKGSLDAAIRDFDKAIRLNPNYAMAFYNRGVARKGKHDKEGAIEDFRKYLDLGGGRQDGDEAEVEKMIQDLSKSNDRTLKKHT